MSEMILNYLRRHPGAGDTLEGITGWWLEMSRMEANVEEVTDVLNSLVKEGSIVTHKVKDGSTFYKSAK